jgi:tetratricopeptide (TPR) repeat protein
MKIFNSFRTLFIACVAFLASCSDENSDPKISPEEARKIAVRDSLSDVIKNLETKVNLLDTTYDREDARKLLGAYQNYYNNNTKDSIGGMYLYKAARLAHGMKNYRQAINLFTNYHDGFTGHPNRPEAALIVGIIYEQDLRDTTSAKKAYQRVIDIHPGTSQAKDAEALLMYADMSEEEMINWLRQKNNQK